MKRQLFLLAYWLVRILASTYRFRATQSPIVTGAGGRGSYVLAVWHQNLFAGILAQSGRRHCVIISQSRDGDPVSFLCKKLGHEVVRGSSRRGGRDKGGKLAKDEMIERLKAGAPGAVTVDGPNGPSHEVKPGIIEMARQSGVAVIPYLTLPSRYWTFPSWDAFRLPKPFSRIDVSYGAPILIPANAEFADFPRYQMIIASALEALEVSALGEQRLRLQLTPVAT